MAFYRDRPAKLIVRRPVIGADFLPFQRGASSLGETPAERGFANSSVPNRKKENVKMDDFAIRL